ncbi:hypothetical protein SISSUDRAFT_257456 [Sistotremastrum suecicum HHB10207 ss-3]|uniref:Uncharacterized protein n=1 Tax=Sistotremastrum suecicum HHB10207 ss-3 TaxID=1314776 RepID=A0A166GD33_9AGAM|nr:hypothetical protein SISSUDRAFT_257456 [Sistotremastrum suecicum HHB10207 ss-3]
MISVMPPTTFSDWTRTSFQTYPNQPPYHSPASPLPLRRHHYIVPNHPPPPPPPSPPKRVSSRRSRISRGTRLEALWEVSEEEESATDSSSSSTGRKSRRKPRPMGITRAADLSPQGSFRIPSGGKSEDTVVDTIPIIANFDDEEGPVFQLDFPRPPSLSSPVSSSRSPSVRSFSSGSSFSNGSPSPSPSLHSYYLSSPTSETCVTMAILDSMSIEQSVPSTPASAYKKPFSDSLDDLWRQIDELMAWVPESPSFAMADPFSGSPENPSFYVQDAFHARHSHSSPPATPGFPSFQLDPTFPRQPKQQARSFPPVPKLPPPPPPKSKSSPRQPLPASPLLPLAAPRPPPRTPVPSDVSSSRFSIISSTSSEASYSRHSTDSHSSRSSVSTTATTVSSANSSSRSNGLRRKAIPVELFMRQ